jgi:GH24 family phage-related lysozyme (muramidase)
VSDRSGQFHRNAQPEFILFHNPEEMLAFIVNFIFNLGAGQFESEWLVNFTGMRSGLQHSVKGCKHNRQSVAE